ncbi:MAG: hypothetical protein E5X80_31270 [Mesorhizobium sp.]|uniref:hypothetical protein n=1 Tax=Mesorhizobium sp. TaxID=1871066 RepID=UPI00120C0F92|nr:hypothetical protein [Mesorhizobium sp.]TIO47592.1 MAG: hypothetical protein E5X78_32175 [Mesorhizobium sp.]TIO56175.1 MAG: hypothetical protein E5X79_31780 [Mesorhizobium sp.]TJV57030.1 MAG: hypothetical protein E5X80_31270 [Mesorhizobium sp.]
MHLRFQRIVESLHPAYERLMAMEPISGAAPKDRVNGIYLFSEGDRHLYVGRAKNITNRYDWHCIPASDHNRASFAFKLAREATGNLKPSYQKGEKSRAGLMLNPEFVAAFMEAKARIRRMSFRYVSEPNPTRQALLEAYVCIVLQTPYNDFDTH